MVCKEAHLDRALALRNHTDLQTILITSNDGYDVKQLEISLPKGVYDISA